MRVTTANVCFTALMPTGAAPTCLRYEDRVAGTHGSPIVDTTTALAVNGALDRSDLSFTRGFLSHRQGGDGCSLGLTRKGHPVSFR